MYYYALVSVAVVMFSFMFLLNEQYEKESGTALTSIFKFSIGTSSAGFIILFAMNGFRLELTPFSAAVALWAVVNNLLYTLCSIRSLSKINLSLFSIFAMLGGMTIPFIAGIIFYDEPITVGKALCFVLIAVSLFFTFQKGEGKKGFIYYAGVFITNGMSGVISKFYSEADCNKASSNGYSAQIALFSFIAAFIILLCIKGDKSLPKKKSLFCMAGCGIVSNVANFILLIALSHLPASAQYPFVTGGVMIVSTIICAFTPNKPKKREIIAVALSFMGIMCLLLT